MRRTLTEVKYFCNDDLSILREEIDEYINNSPCPKSYEFEAGQIVIGGALIIQPIFIYKLG